MLFRSKAWHFDGAERSCGLHVCMCARNVVDSRRKTWPCSWDRKGTRKSCSGCAVQFFAWWHCSRHIGRIPPHVAHSWPPWRVTNSVSHHQCCTRWHHSVLQLSHICLLSSWKYTGSFICGISETLPCCPKLTAANYLPASSQKCCLIGCDHRPARLNDLIISVTVCHLVTQLT